MSYTLNGRARDTVPVSTLKHLVAEITGRELSDTGQPLDERRLGVAVAVNAEVVPRHRWAGVTINDGDDIEVLTAVQGG
ncbi:MAG: thiamine biosynthesis protein ThiS [Micrococcaceae bacterium]|jgi:sulfur carrier protein|uniref:sulfur carrier protein ThiS n=1 Tax=Arthrobacter sp. PL16 TaxID=3071720 RepID=UPI002E09A56F|nr:thiamine biosynthesis protein ThiS [Micrococcaceae bacterium]MEC5199202.1 sulfur carrier protein [Arthrobacter sp. PL16]